MTANLKLWSEVEDVMASGSVARRGKIVRHITDLFIVGSSHCSEQEVDLFDDVLSRLATQIEVSARALLAVRLAPIPNAPPRIIRSLAFDDEIDVAGPVLEQSERLDEATLIENARQKGQAHLLAISRRRALSAEVTEVLVERGDQQVVWSTAENPGAQFSESNFTRLVRRSESDDRLAVSIGSRPELPPHLFRRLLARASAAARIKLEATHPQARRDVRLAVAEATQRIAEETLGPARTRTSYVHLLQQRGQLDDKRVEMVARTGRFDDVVTALALLAELPFDFVNRAMKQERTEMVLIIAKAAALSWCTVKAILRARLGDREVPGGEIAKCLASYERLRATSAQEIVRFHRQRGDTPSRRPI